MFSFIDESKWTISVSTENSTSKQVVITRTITHFPYGNVLLCPYNFYVSFGTIFHCVDMVSLLSLLVSTVWLSLLEVAFNYVTNSDMFTNVTTIPVLSVEIISSFGDISTKILCRCCHF